MAPKKRAKMESSPIVTRSGIAKLVSDPLPPNSKKAKRNISGNSGASSSMASKKAASAIVARISTRRGKAKLNSAPADTQQPKSKKRANAKPSGNLTSRDKGKAKLESELPSRDSDLSMTLAKLTISENRVLFSPAPKKMASSILTRSTKGKAEMESSTTVTTRSSTRIAKGKEKLESNLIQSPPKSKKRANVQISTRSSKGKTKAKEEEPPKSKKAKTAIFDGSTSSSTILSRRSKGKAKLGSDSTAADPLPPKSKKAKTTTSGGNSSVTIRADVEPSSTRVTRSSTRNS